MSTADLAASGFVRMPRAWVSLELSPGAKVLLLHLCAAANDAGESWYKYAKLGAIIGRSKAAVSGYVTELTAAGLVETERQRTANGYNAHLLIRLVGWSELTRAWSRMSRARRSTAPASASPAPAAERAAGPSPSSAEASPAISRPSTERRVRSAERKYPSGTKEIHLNNAARAPAPVAPAEAMAAPDGLVWSDEDEARWRRVKLGDLGLDFDRPPENALLAKVIDLHEALRRRAGVTDRRVLEEKARRALDTFLARRSLACDPATAAEGAAILAEHGRTPGGVARAVAYLEAIWAPHWRRFSTRDQLRATLSSAEARKAILSDEDRLLWRFAARALMARRELALRRRTRERLAQAAPR